MYQTKTHHQAVSLSTHTHTHTFSLSLSLSLSLAPSSLPLSLLHTCMRDRDGQFRARDKRHFLPLISVDAVSGQVQVRASDKR